MCPRPRGAPTLSRTHYTHRCIRAYRPPLRTHTTRGARHTQHTCTFAYAGRRRARVGARTIRDSYIRAGRPRDARVGATRARSTRFGRRRETSSALGRGREIRAYLSNRERLVYQGGPPSRRRCAPLLQAARTQKSRARARARAAFARFRSLEKRKKKIHARRDRDPTRRPRRNRDFGVCVHFLIRPRARETRERGARDLRVDWWQWKRGSWRWREGQLLSLSFFFYLSFSLSLSFSFSRECARRENSTPFIYQNN